MFCLFCNNESTDVVNSRLTKGGSQVWRRRKCNVCGKAATTYERFDMTHLMILTSSPKEKSNQLTETPYSRSKLFYSLAKAFTESNQDISQVDGLLDTIETKLSRTNQDSLSSDELTTLALETIKPVNLSVFMHYLASHGQISNNTELKKLIKQY